MNETEQQPRDPAEHKKDEKVITVTEDAVRLAVWLDEVKRIAAHRIRMDEHCDAVRTLESQQAASLERIAIAIEKLVVRPT